jgi:hypothetical protein
MCVYLFCCRALVEGDEAVEEVVAGGVVVVTAGVVGEVVTEWGAGEFVGKEIDFVEEEDLGRVSERLCCNLKNGNVLLRF